MIFSDYKAGVAVGLSFPRIALANACFPEWLLITPYSTWKSCPGLNDKLYKLYGHSIYSIGKFIENKLAHGFSKNLIS